MAGIVPNVKENCSSHDLFSLLLYHYVEYLSDLYKTVKRRGGGGGEEIKEEGGKARDTVTLFIKLAGDEA